MRLIPIIAQIDELGGQQHKPEACGVDAEVGDVEAAIGNTAVPLDVGPAPNHTDRASRWSFWIHLSIRAVVSIPIAHPLLHISAHIMYAKFIG